MIRAQSWQPVTHEPRPDGTLDALKSAMHEPATALHTVDLASLGERLSALRLCDAASLTAVRRSLAQHGQLTALTVFGSHDQLEVLDGFKRARAARALGWPTLLARVDAVDCVEAKLRLCTLHDRRGLTALEEGWLVRSLYREDGLSLPEIARRMVRHRSWVWRRLMLVEVLDTTVQADVRLGLLAARAAVAVSRLPRGNQQAASAVVMRRGLTVRQTELLVDEVLSVAQPDTAAAATLLARRLEERSLAKIPGPRSTRAVRSEADWMSADILKAREVSARLQARLGATRLETFTPGAAELLRDALVRLQPVLRALDQGIDAALWTPAAASQ
jgi:ParB-like chromosome segregation protein Spo0J